MRRIFALLASLALAVLLVSGAALSGSEEPAQAAFPGKNGRIAFAANQNGIFSDDEIYTMLPDGSDWRQLTTTPNGASNPAWSADGTKIAFHAIYQGSQEIYTMNSDGSGLRQLTPTDGIPSNQPVWSPDGTKIAFWSYPGPGQEADVFVMNADGSGVKRLTTDPEHHDAAPDWSPDGTKIAFQKGIIPYGDADSDIWVMDASDGTGQDNLTPDSAASVDGDPNWSPDGTKIAFVGAQQTGAASEIYTVNPDGSSLSPLTNTPEIGEVSPAWSPDGTQILFGVAGQIDIWKMRADGTNRTNLTNNESPIRETVPDWQPEPSDTMPPKVKSTIPNANATEVAPTANVKATFSEEMKASTIKGTTFKLFKKGTTTQIPAQVSYNADAETAKLDPTNNLRRGVAYKAVVTTWAKDLAGNRLDQNSSTTGLQQKVWFFRVDD